MPKKPVAEPIVYKTLVAKGVTVQIPQDIVKEIPYIETLFSGRFAVNEEEGTVKSDEINPNLLKVIVRYLEGKKLYKLLACLPKTCDLFQLLELYHFLALPAPIKTSAEEIRRQLLLMPSIHVTTQKELVNFAFVIFHAYPLIDYNKEKKIRDMVYNTVMYVFKTNNNQSFKLRAKYHLLKLAKKCVWFSYNQFEKIKALRVEGSLDDSDTESIGPIFDDPDDSFDEYCDEYCDDFAYIDSDDELAMMFGHAMGFGMHSFCYDDSDDDDFECFSNNDW